MSWLAIAAKDRPTRRRRNGFDSLQCELMHGYPWSAKQQSAALTELPATADAITLAPSHEATQPGGPRSSLGLGVELRVTEPRRVVKLSLRPGPCQAPRERVRGVES